MLDGGCEDDLLFGDNVTLIRRVTYAVDTDTIISRDVTSLRFETLIGQVLYNRTDLDPALSGAPVANADNSGALLVDNIPRAMRDNNLAWWADFRVLDLWHNFLIEDGLAAVGSFGNDYLAGGPEDDMIFGGLGNDIIMGDGSITSAVSGTSVVGASRSPDGCVSVDTGLPGLQTHAGTCDLVGDLDLVPTFEVQPKSNAEGEGDGSDYIEGGGGNDVIFGGLGQDDIIGGSSDFFTLITPDMRPDGADIIFGDGGIHSDRNDNGGLAPGALIPGTRHASDADTIVGDNGRIVRIVGTKGVDLCGATCDPGETFYVSYKYDDVYGASGQILVRGVTLLDYTPGGPDFRPDRFFDPTAPGACSSSAVETQDGCSPLYLYVTNSAVDPFGGQLERRGGWWEIFGNDEIHGGLSDDFVYGGGGNDVVYGDADDDEIIGGWGNDWIDGGVGQDAILGDDGRIFASRNSSAGWTAAGLTCTGTGSGTCYSEPLNAITALQPMGTCPDNHSSECGDYLDQYIATPGQVQTDIINIKGDLKKTVDLTPYNLSPTAQRRRPDQVRRQQLRRRDLRWPRRRGGAQLPDWSSGIATTRIRPSARRVACSGTSSTAAPATTRSPAARRSGTATRRSTTARPTS